MVNFMIDFDVIGVVERIASKTLRECKLIPPIRLMPVLCLVALWPPGIAIAGDIAGSASVPQRNILLAEVSTDSCVAQCEGVRKQCKILCAETTARAAVETGDDPHKPESACLYQCEEDYTFCVDSCSPMEDKR